MAKEKKDKKSKAQQRDDFFKYTTRDLGQEFIMKRKLVAVIIVLVFVTCVMAAFIALYIDETKRVQETYNIQFHKCLETTITDIESYNGAEADFDFRYRRIVADMSSVNSFSFLLKGNDEHRKTVNELYTAFLKYPEQMSQKMEEAKTALEDIYANLDKGYDEADEIIASLDLKGY